jgi:hypothetical protein
MSYDNETDDIISDENHNILEEILNELYPETPEDRWRAFLK